MNRRWLHPLAVALTAVLLCGAEATFADEPTAEPDTTRIQPVVPRMVPADRLDLSAPQSPGTFHQADEVERNWPKPTPTLLKSMVFPGWGQFTNRQYVKAAIVFGLESWYIGNMVYNWRKSNDYLADFRANPDNLTAYNNYQFYRGNRNDYMWYLGITVFVSMFDAYVDAHLRPYEHDRIPDVAPPPGIAFVIKTF